MLTLVLATGGSVFCPQTRPVSPVRRISSILHLAQLLSFPQRCPGTRGLPGACAKWVMVALWLPAGHRVILIGQHFQEAHIAVTHGAQRGTFHSTRIAKKR